jgi:hypothetical protein
MFVTINCYQDSARKRDVRLSGVHLFFVVVNIPNKRDMIIKIE